MTNSNKNSEPPFHAPFVADLVQIKKLYNANEKPFMHRAIPNEQRSEWSKINQYDCCKPTPTEIINAGKNFSPLRLKREHGHKLTQDEYVFTCAYRTSQDFWRYEDTQQKKFSLQYPYIEEVLRLAVFVRMESIRCVLLIMKLCFEKYWKRNYPLNTSFDFVYGQFRHEFEHNNEAILLSCIFREQNTSENLPVLCNLFNVYFPGTDFYSCLSTVLARGKQLIHCGIDDLSVNTFIKVQGEMHHGESYGNASKAKQAEILDIFESVFDILRVLAQHIIEKEGINSLDPLIRDINNTEDKLRKFYISCIQNRGEGSDRNAKQMSFDVSWDSMDPAVSSGIIDKQTMRLINEIEKYNQLGTLLKDNPWSILTIGTNE